MISPFSPLSPGGPGSPTCIVVHSVVHIANYMNTVTIIYSCLSSYIAIVEYMVVIGTRKHFEVTNLYKLFLS